MSVEPDFSQHPAARGRGVTAVLGPTNTGKTHLAIERMLGHRSGMIGLPLRLLAREVYDRVAARVGVEQVALVTGEEKVKPDGARYWVATVEAMPRDLDLDFVAVDEVQLAADLERGHVFTDRILRQRGREETLLLGAGTMRPILTRLMPGLNVITRPRLSHLAYSGQKKITRLPARSAIVAFSADEVYAIAELIRRQRGGAAVVLGALSPRTRNAQVEMYQSGDVDFLVATDAIGMGLNLDVDHVAFASKRKFDGFQFRDLNPVELGQIAGRAGRHLKDGTFGVTGRVDPFDQDLVERIEGHDFAPVELLQWRNPLLDFTSLDGLRRSLAEAPREDGFTRSLPTDDVQVLEAAARDPELRGLASGPEAVERLWEVCQVPDYRKIAPANHAELVSGLYRHLMLDGVIPQDWFAAQVAHADRPDGDLDTLANRIAHIRTWTFVANRADWLADPEHWQETTRAVEDRLSDALHERLTQRFVDRRTSVLARRLRENAILDSEIEAGGSVCVEGHHVGHLSGLTFVPDAGEADQNRKAASAAAAKVLAGELTARAEQLAMCKDEDLALADDGAISWKGDLVGRLERGETALSPRAVLIADELLAGTPRQKAEARLGAWVAARIETLLAPLIALANDESLSGMTRGLAFQIVEAIGVLERGRVAEEVKALPQEERAGLRRHGVRFGAHNLFVPALLKPGPRIFAAQLWALHDGGIAPADFAEIAALVRSGRMSVAVDGPADARLYRAFGYQLCHSRAIRVDILERLADLIRAALAWRPQSEAPRPEGAVDGRVFTISEAMTSLAGCAGDDFAAILLTLGYRSERRPKPAVADHVEQAAPSSEPAVPQEVNAVGDAEADQTAEAAESGQGDTQAADADAPSLEMADEIVVWRPGRRAGGARGPAPRRDKLPQADGDGAGQEKTRPARQGRRKGKSGKPHGPRSDMPPGRSPRKPDPKPDPLSPFAALAELRKELVKRDR